MLYSTIECVHNYYLMCQSHTQYYECCICVSTVYSIASQFDIPRIIDIDTCTLF